MPSFNSEPMKMRKVAELICYKYNKEVPRGETRTSRSRHMPIIEREGCWSATGSEEGSGFST